MSSIEVHISLKGQTYRVGSLLKWEEEDSEYLAFEYHSDWLKNELHFSLQPSLPRSNTTFYPKRYQRMFGALGDSAPDSWGRRLMQRMEGVFTKSKQQTPKLLLESDYLLGVTDFCRMGAIRFKYSDSPEYLQPISQGIPQPIEIEQITKIARKLESGDESLDELRTIVEAGSSLGGARPKASVIDDAGNLAIAKFPRKSDHYCIQTWEHIALLIAERAGIRVPTHTLLRVGDFNILLSRRFDRQGEIRIPFLSAMSMLNAKDGDVGSYPEIVDQLSRHGLNAKKCAEELFRRLVLNVLITNTDDHLRNHGFLWANHKGWELSPVYDINPVPRRRGGIILATNVSLTDPTCSIELAIEQHNLFGLTLKKAKSIAAIVGVAVSQWKNLADRFKIDRNHIDYMESAFEHDDLAIVTKWK